MATIEFDFHLLLTILPDEATVKRKDQLVVLQVPHGKSVNQILEELKINLSQAVIPLINGQTSDLDYLLEPDDKVRLLPQIAGGD